MTDAEKQIREALAVGPTPGPWYLRTNRHPTTDGRAWGWLDTQPPGGSQYAPPGLQITWERGSKSATNAAYIAACHPAAISELLDEMERLRRRYPRAREGAEMSDLIERLRDKTRLRAAHGLTGWVLAEEALLAEAANEIERLRAALREAIDLRVKMFRASDPEGDTDGLTDDQIALRDPFASKWIEAVGGTT